MKKSIFILALTVFATGAVFTSCNTSAEKADTSEINKEVAQQKLDKAKQDYTKQYNKFNVESDEKILANKHLIADLKKYSKNKKKEAKIEYEKTISFLETKNQAMKEKVNNYKEEGLDQWESFKNEFNHDMDELDKSLKDLVKDNVT